MKIRVTGTRTQVDILIDRIKRSRIGIVNSVSKWHPWIRDDPESKIGSVYIDLDIEYGEIITIDKVPPEALPEAME